MNHVVFVQKFAPSNSPPLTADFETKSASAAPILKKKMKVLLLSGGSDPPEVALPPRRGGLRERPRPGMIPKDQESYLE